MARKTAVTQIVKITPPRFGFATFYIRGTTPYMQARFSKKAQLMAKMEEGSAAKNKKIRDARDFEEDCDEATHFLMDGSCGIPASAFRQAMISACRLVNAKMTLAKMSVFIDADGIDRADGATPLIRIKGERSRADMHVRNATGVVDIRSRPIWHQWEATINLRFDLDQFTETDIANLMSRVGFQVGIGEGRPDSKASSGLGYGMFELAGPDTK
jgi:hypothetical protein